MIDQEHLNQASRVALAHDLRVLQGFRLAETEHDHVAKLLDHMAPGPHTMWVDIGCGFGEPARIMREIRPDLRFWLVNNNVFQLSQAPEDMPSSCVDMHELPFDDRMFDGAMFLYSLCHADNPMEALREAARVTKPGGALFVYDYVRVGGDDDLAMQYLASRFMPIGWLALLSRVVGWDLDDHVYPEGSDAVFRSLFHDQELYALIFNDLMPVIWKGIRR